MDSSRYSNDPRSEEDSNFFDKYSSTGDGQFSIDESFPLDSEVSADRHYDNSLVTEPKNLRKSDNVIYEEICELFMQTPKIDATEVDVSVQDGDVTLKGFVDNSAVKALAETLSQQIPGVHGVFNKLKAIHISEDKNTEHGMVHGTSSWV
jgi:BON domain